MWEPFYSAPAPDALETSFVKVGGSGKKRTDVVFWRREAYEMRSERLLTVRSKLEVLVSNEQKVGGHGQPLFRVKTL